MGRKNADSLVGLPGASNYDAADSVPIEPDSIRFRLRNGGWSLTVEGFMIDTVDQVGERSQGGNIPAEWLDLAGWDGTDHEVLEAFWRTLVADRGSNGRKPPRYYRRVCEDYVLDGMKSGDLNTAGLINEGRSTGKYASLYNCEHLI